MARIRQAQNDMEPIYAETCPQYLLKLADSMVPRGHGGCACLHIDVPRILEEAESSGTVESRFEGAKMVCSPPVRESPHDLEAVWKGLSNGTVTTFSSDHCPSRFEHPKGKKKGLLDGKPDFTKIPNGLAGVETRQPLLMTYGVETGKSESAVQPDPHGSMLTHSHPGAICSGLFYTASSSLRATGSQRYNCTRFGRRHRNLVPDRYNRRGDQ